MSKMSEWQLAPSTLAQWVGAIATTAAVIVALFKEEFMRRLRYPELTVRIQPFAPDCVKTPLQLAMLGTLDGPAMRTSSGSGLTIVPIANSVCGQHALQITLANQPVGRSLAPALASA